MGRFVAGVAGVFLVIAIILISLFTISCFGLHPFRKTFQTEQLVNRKKSGFRASLFLVSNLTRFLKTLNGLVREMWCARSNWLCKLVSPVCASQYWKVSLETDYYCLVASTTTR